MNLLFDLNATQPNISGKRHGGGKYGEIVFRRMVERGIVFSCFYDSRKWLNPEIKELCLLNSIKLFDIKDNSITDIVKKNHIQRIYSALPGALAELTCCEVYGTVHGLREFETPYDKIFYKYRTSLKEKFKFTIKRCLLKYFLRYKHKQYLKRYINTSFHLITVSEHSRYAFLSYFPELKGTELKVFYSPNTSMDHTIEKDVSAGRYFMAVSGNRWEKNNLRAIMAFDRLVSENRLPKDIRMKVTGTTGDNYKYKVKNPNRFDFLGYVEDSELERLYANAFLFVYPSLNEGFGYPPMEAMKYGVPVIASPLSSMAEICGSGALYFDPYSVEEIMNRMMMMMDEKRHNEYSKKGLEQYLKVRERQERDLDLLIDYIYT